MRIFALFAIIMIIANLPLLPDFCCFSSQVLPISHQGGVFNCIPIDDSIFYQNSSIFFFSKYCAKDILYTLNFCQCFKASIQVIFLSTNLASLISILEWSLTKFSVFEFFVSNGEKILDCKYPTLLNWVYAGIPAF